MLKIMDNLVENYIETNSLFPPLCLAEKSIIAYNRLVRVFIQNSTPNFILRTQVLTISMMYYCMVFNRIIKSSNVKYHTKNILKKIKIQFMDSQIQKYNNGIKFSRFE